MTWVEYCIKNDVSQWAEEYKYRRIYFEALAHHLFMKKQTRKKIWRNVLACGSRKLTGNV